MAKWFDCLTEESRDLWPEIYKRLTGKKWEIPTKERGITCDTPIEDLEEIAKFMEEVPNPTRRE